MSARAGTGESIIVNPYIPFLNSVSPSSRSSPGSEGNASIKAQTSHHPSLQPHSDDSSPPSELPAGLTGLHQPQPATSHPDPLQNALFVLFVIVFSWERRAVGWRVHG